MSDGDPEDRAKKLQGRFSTSEADEADGASDPPDTGEASNTHSSSDTPDSSNAPDAPNTPDTDEASSTPLRDRPTKLLYLDDDLKRELELAFDEISLRYKRERDEDLQQNEDWWPVLLQIGYEAIGDVSDVDLDTFDQARDGDFSVPKPTDEE